MVTTTPPSVYPDHYDFPPFFTRYAPRPLPRSLLLSAKRLTPQHTAQRNHLVRAALNLGHLHPRVLPPPPSLAPPRLRRARDRPLLEQAPLAATIAQGRSGSARLDGGRGRNRLGRRGGGGLLAQRGGVGRRHLCVDRCHGAARQRADAVRDLGGRPDRLAGVPWD